MKAGLPRLRWDPKGHYLQVATQLCLTFPMQEAELEEALQIFAKVFDSLPIGSSSHQNYFLACCSPCDCPNEASDFVRV